MWNSSATWSYDYWRNHHSKRAWKVGSFWIVLFLFKLCLTVFSKIVTLEMYQNLSKRFFVLNFTYWIIVIFLNAGLSTINCNYMEVKFKLCLWPIIVEVSKQVVQRCSVKKSAILFKKRLCHRCFLVNFVKFFRASFS